MDFFQKLGNTLSNTGKDIAERTKKFSDTTKLNHEITKQQETINKIYSEIGKLYFENYNHLDYPDLKNLCISIQESNDKINEYQKEITQIKGIINCPNCNKEISINSSFCDGCGCKLKENIPISENSETSTENTIVPIQEENKTEN